MFTLVATMSVITFASVAMAQVIVTPANQQGWINSRYQTGRSNKFYS